MIYCFHKIQCSTLLTVHVKIANPSHVPTRLGRSSALKRYTQTSNKHTRAPTQVSHQPHTTHNGPKNPTRPLRQEARSLLQHSRRTRTVRLRLFCNHRSESRKYANTSIALNRRLHAYAKRTNDSTNAMLIIQSGQRVTLAR